MDNAASGVAADLEPEAFREPQDEPRCERKRGPEVERVAGGEQVPEQRERE